MNKFKSGQLVLVTPIHDFYESTINFPRDKHALYIEPQPDPLLHTVMIDNKLHIESYLDLLRYQRRSAYMFTLIELVGPSYNAISITLAVLADIIFIGVLTRSSKIPTPHSVCNNCEAPKERHRICSVCGCSWTR